MDDIASTVQACEWARSQLLIFSGNVFDPLIYYSHLVPLVTSFAFGLFVYSKNRGALATNALFLIIIFLAIWLFGDLALWATERNELTMFFWSLINLAEPFVYAFSFYFVYVFIAKKDSSFAWKLWVFLSEIL